jgi:hypothetical protein
MLATSLQKSIYSATSFCSIPLPRERHLPAPAGTRLPPPAKYNRVEFAYHLQYPGGLINYIFEVVFQGPLRVPLSGFMLPAVLPARLGTTPSRHTTEPYGTLKWMRSF